MDIDGDAERKLFLILIAQYVGVHWSSFRARHVFTIYSILGLENWCAMPTRGINELPQIYRTHTFDNNVSAVRAKYSKPWQAFTVTIFTTHIKFFYFYFLIAFEGWVERWRGRSGVARSKMVICYFAIGWIMSKINNFSVLLCIRLWINSY